MSYRFGLYSVLCLIAFPFYAQQTGAPSLATGGGELPVFTANMLGADGEMTGQGSRSTCFPQLANMRVHRGREVRDMEVGAEGIAAPLSADLEARGFRVNYDGSARIDTTNASVTAYRLEGTVEGPGSPEAQLGSVPVFVIRHRTEDGEFELQIDVEKDQETGELGVLRIFDVTTGAAAVFDMVTASISCPTNTGSCLADCALKKLCSGLTSCEAKILTVEIADCLFGSKVGCVGVAYDLAKAALCMGVDCWNSCKEGGTGSCAHSPCVTGVKLSKSCSTCVKKVCDYDSYCCKNKWDSACVKLARTKFCKSTCK